MVSKFMQRPKKYYILIAMNWRFCSCIHWIWDKRVGTFWPANKVLARLVLTSDMALAVFFLFIIEFGSNLPLSVMCSRLAYIHYFEFFFLFLINFRFFNQWSRKEKQICQIFNYYEWIHQEFRMQAICFARRSYPLGCSAFAIHFLNIFFSNFLLLYQNILFITDNLHTEFIGFS